MVIITINIINIYIIINLVFIDLICFYRENKYFIVLYMLVTIVDIHYSIILIYTLYIQRFLQGKIY